MIAAVVNPAAGQGRGAERLGAVQRACRQAGRELRVVRTRGPGGVVPAVREALEASPELVVLVGGDGSVGELCRAYAGVPPELRPPLLLVPGGRGNSFYKAVLGDAPWEDYLGRALRDPWVRWVDAGEVAETGDTWALGFSCGYLHDCVAATRHFPGLRGRALYAAAGAWAAARPRPLWVEVEVDGKAVYAGRSLLAAVAGGPFRGGRLLLFPAADLQDGLLDVVVVEAVGAGRLAGVLRAGAAGRHLALEEVHGFRGREVRLRADPWRCELDGTIFSYAGEVLTLRCLPGLLPLALPGPHPGVQAGS